MATGASLPSCIAKVSDQSKNGRAVYARDGTGRVYPGPNLSKRAREAAIFPYLLSQCDGKHTKPYVGDRYHLHSLARRLDVPGSDPGLVLTLCRELGIGSNDADRLS